jgi:hypothetical protein
MMVRASPHWRLGGGVHFSNLFASKFDKRSIWPTLGALFEKDWFAECAAANTHHS